jgi:hypothetical protein
MEEVGSVLNGIASTGGNLFWPKWNRWEWKKYKWLKLAELVYGLWRISSKDNSTEKKNITSLVQSFTIAP